MKHLDMKELLALAHGGRHSDHLDVCSFCSEQYQLALDFLGFSPGSAQGEEGEKTLTSAENRQRGAYRLAAQSSQTASPVFRLRRTWYFENNSMILRVIEDVQKGSLTGFFISERPTKDILRIRFDGIDSEFTPDGNGVFEIGAATINIEPMNVMLLHS